MLQKAIELGADYVDVEFDSFRHITRRDSSKLIISYHNFKETPHNINEIYEDISQCKPDIVKVVTYANDNSEIVSSILLAVIGTQIMSYLF